MVQITEEMRAEAEIVYGDEAGQEHYKLLLKEVGLPTGLLPVKDIIECGYVEETGFVWLKQKRKIEHKFEKLGRLATYATEVTAYVEKHRIKKLTGVKVKEMLIWVSLSDIYIDGPANDKIVFKSPTGLYRTFPASSFENEEVTITWESKKAKADLSSTTTTKETTDDAKEVKGAIASKEVKEATGIATTEMKEAIATKE